MGVLKKLRGLRRGRRRGDVLRSRRGRPLPLRRYKLELLRRLREETQPVLVLTRRPQLPRRRLSGRLCVLKWRQLLLKPRRSVRELRSGWPTSRKHPRLRLRVLLSKLPRFRRRRPNRLRRSETLQRRKLRLSRRRLIELGLARREKWLGYAKKWKGG